jgi:hypothetical protein
LAHKTTTTKPPATKHANQNLLSLIEHPGGDILTNAAGVEYIFGPLVPEALDCPGSGAW